MFEKNSELKSWPENSESMLVIDESGVDELKSVKKDILNGKNKNGSINNWFVLSGIIIKKEDFQDIREKIINFKLKYWRNGTFEGKRVVLHCKNIYSKNNKCFSDRFIKNKEEFLDDLSYLIDNINFKVISVGINKFNHTKRNLAKGNEPYNPYTYALTLMLERYCYEIDKEGSIIFESRNLNQDEKIFQKVKDVCDSRGTYYHKIDFFQNISKIINFNPKLTEKGNESYFMLELADIVAYSTMRFLRDNKKGKLYKSIEKKYRLINGQHKGIGLKIVGDVYH